MRRVCWTVNDKYTLNVTCVLLEKKKVENLCSFNAHTDLCRHKCGSKFCRSRKKIVLLLSAEERLKRFSFIGNENLSK